MPAAKQLGWQIVHLYDHDVPAVMEADVAYDFNTVMTFVHNVEDRLRWGLVAIYEGDIPDCRPVRMTAPAALKMVQLHNAGGPVPPEPPKRKKARK